MKKDDFEYLLELLKQYAGWELGEDKFFILDRKIYNFVREKDYPSVEDLIADLHQGQKNLLWQVIEALALSDTCFYRDYKVFSAFEGRILPYLREANRGSHRLRVWSLGCSSGQETYSIAISIKNRMFAISDWDIKLIGTDISTTSISKAQKGQYNQFEVQMGLNARTIIDNFHQEGEQWIINSEIKNMIEFRRYNLLDKVTFTEPFDVIFCRNVLRFFSKDKQAEALAMLYNNQIPGGFLYVGMGEELYGLERYYDKVKGMKCLYQAKIAAETTKPQSQEIKKPEEINAPKMPKFVRPDNLTSLSSGRIKKVNFED